MTTTAVPRHSIPSPRTTAGGRTVGRPRGHGGRGLAPTLAPRPLGAALSPARVLPRQLTPRADDPTTERPDLGVTYQLAQAVRRVAVTPRLWRPAIRFESQGPYAVRVPGPKGVDVWLRTWLPGQHTGLVDLGSCATAFAVVQGSLHDIRADEVLGTWVTHLPTQSVRIIEPGVVHDLRGGLDGHTVTIHAYSPRLRAVTEHSWDDGRLERLGTVSVAAPWQDPRVTA
ncbi:MAG TPA: hypothetical protein VFL94_01370 [Actinomycetales bacterium]|nr:hypothetical protein [Actinomycetales bacterium]